MSINYLQDILNDPQIAAILAGPPPPMPPTPMMMAGLPPQSDYQDGEIPDGSGPQYPPPQAMGGRFPQPPTLGPVSAMPPGYGPMGSPARNPMGPSPFPIPGPYDGRPPAPRQTFGQRIKSAIPAMVRAGIAGAATPNVAAGGAVDIFRAMQSGNKANQDYDLMVHNRSRESMLDAQNAAKTQAEIERDRGATRYYDAEIGWRNAEAKKADRLSNAEEAYRKWQTLPDGPEGSPEAKAKEAAKDNYMLVAHGYVKPEKETDLWFPLATGLGTYNRKTGAVQGSANPLAENRLITAMKLRGIEDTPENRKTFFNGLTPREQEEIQQNRPPAVPRTTEHYETNDQGEVTAFSLGPNGEHVTTNLGVHGKTKPPREPSATQLRQEHQQLVRNQAGMIYHGTVKWAAENLKKDATGHPIDPSTGEPITGVALEQLAIHNLQSYYGDNPDVMENLGEIATEIQHIARTQGLVVGKVTKESLADEARRKNRGQTGGGRGAPQAQPLPGRGGVSQVAPVADNGLAPAGPGPAGPDGPAGPAGPPPLVVQQMTPGKVTRLRDGTRWYKVPGSGRVFQIDPNGKVMLPTAR